MTDELFNAISHGLGEIMVVVGTVMAFLKMGWNQSNLAKWSLVIYCGSLNILYISSTLFHAFFAMDRSTVHVFAILDYSGIYVLIAGTWSAILGIGLSDEWWGFTALILTYVACGLGIFTTAFDVGPGGDLVKTVVCPILGWSVLPFLYFLGKKHGWTCPALILGGGLFYSAGIYWFMRRRHFYIIPDHTIWHLFVMGGSMAHYLSVYLYILPARKPAIDTTGDDDVDIALQYVSVPPL